MDVCWKNDDNNIMMVTLSSRQPSEQDLSSLNEGNHILSTRIFWPQASLQRPGYFYLVPKYNIGEFTGNWISKEAEMDNQGLFCRSIFSVAATVVRSYMNNCYCCLN